jgi:sugar fermentation stimulation protein A
VVSAAALAELPRAPGVYALVLALGAGVTLSVGRGRSEAFAPGYYVYVGSAMGGLAGRVRRHVAGPRRRHWHIDALLDVTPVVEVWYLANAERLECAWASRLGVATGLTPTPFAFGASDCPCRTHLFYGQERPTVAALGWPGAQAVKPCAERAESAKEAEAQERLKSAA